MACTYGQCHRIPGSRPDCCTHRRRVRVPYTEHDPHNADSYSADGTATATVPAEGWATQDLDVYFGRTFAARRTATRSIPTTSATSQPTSPPTSPAKKTNVGAIAGGAVGGAIVLIGVIAGVFFCLRSRRRKQGPQGGSQPSEVPATPDPRSPDMAQKSVTSASIMQGSTLASPTPRSPAYSPQASPPPTSSPWRGEMHMPNSYYQGPPSPHHQGSPSSYHHSGDWTQQANYAQPGNYPYQQTYYPPPPDPSASPAKESEPYVMSMQEMPDVRSPANAVAEMAGMRSPLPKHGGH